MTKNTNVKAAASAIVEPTTVTAVTPTQQAKLDELSTTSDRIRYLAAEKYTTSQIAKILDIKYQHVRNVLITPVKNPGRRGRPVLSS